MPNNVSDLMGEYPEQLSQETPPGCSRHKAVLD